MGLFDFLKPKENVPQVCPICNREIAQYNDRKTANGIICVDCKDKVEALRPGSEYARMTVDEIRDLLASQGLESEDLGQCPICGEKLPALPKKLKDGMICNNCEQKMRITYYVTYSYKEEYELNSEEKRQLEAQNAGSLRKSNRLVISEDELDMLSVEDVRQDIERDNKRIAEAPSLFPECSAVGYMDSVDEYGQEGETWFPVLCCSGTFKVGDTIIRIQGNDRYEHTLEAIVYPDGTPLEECAEDRDCNRQELNKGEWAWVKVTGQFMAAPDYTGDNYIVKK